MRIIALTIENFRGYLRSTTIEFTDFTSIIGRNDVGKSTLLDALEIFFNGGKPDSDDAHVDGRGQPTRISCHFVDLPPQVVIDAQAPTTLAAEYLLNHSGALEIVKQYDLRASRIMPRVFARANHPNQEGLDDLLQLSNAKLKARAQEHGIDLQHVDRRVNTSLRRAIWAKTENLRLQEQLVALNDQDAKTVWSLLQKELPTFALFQADRQSRDDDAEIANPFDTAIKDAVKGMEEKLDEIKSEVQKKVEEVAERTLAKLKEMDPSLASELRTVFRAEPKWAGFKLTLMDHRDIPINKRGSGVRRLVLLNFFRAEAERRQESSNAPGIIYAIEEPESSQHPSNQRLLIDALLDLSANDGTQVIITTHVPGIAALAPTDSIRYISRNKELHPHVIDRDENMLRLVADELGVSPDKRVKLLLYVEGPNDVTFLEHASRITKQIDLSTDTRVAFVLTGGGNLKHWVNRQYLRGLELREIHIYDRDNDHGYQSQVDSINGRGNGDWATLTSKREIENYVHPDAVHDAIGIDIEIDDDVDVPLVAARAIHEASDSQKAWAEVKEEKQDQKASRAKRRLCNVVIGRMTKQQLEERDQSGEIEGWFSQIAATLD